MSYGILGKILHVDLTNRRIEIEEKDESFYRTYLGCRGIGYHYLLKEVPPRIDPLSPENIMVLATGIMTGSPLSASCRFATVGKSPLTGTAGESEAGGFFGPELKMAGFDAVVLKGKADKPVYLWVTDGKAEIRDAERIADLEARGVEEAIKEELGSKKIRIAQTGPAGMKLVRFANVGNNLGHFNGRNGFGALMGSKNIRAVAALGANKLQFADPDYLRETAKRIAKTFKDDPMGKALFEYGTTGTAEALSGVGGLPVDNFRRSSLEDPTLVGPKTYTEMLLKARKGCYSCAIRCKRGIALDDPKFGVDSNYGGPEYETIASLGSNLNIVDLKAIAKGNEICNRYCMDTISAGMTIAFACECFEKGIITKADTDGLELRFGDADMMVKLLEMTGKREGFGDMLAEGTNRLAEKWGVKDAPFNTTVKGQELAMHDPRIKVGVGFGYATTTYGADHMAVPHDPFFADEKFNSFQVIKTMGIYEPMHPTKITNEKIGSYMRLDYFWKLQDALGLCVFGFMPRGPIEIDVITEGVRAMTGWNVSLYELMRSTERGSIMAKAFNSREGFTVKDDTLPKRLFEPKPDGPNAGKQIFSEEEFLKAVKLINEVMGCDPETGRPLRGKLFELGLDWVEDLLNND